MFENTKFLRIFFYFTLISFFLFGSALACDTTPSLTPSNVIDNGDGTYYMDISVCIGSEGSADGFDLYFNNDINIIGTTVTEVTSTTGNVADVSVNNGIWLANFEEYNTTGVYFENGSWGLDCIEFGIIVSDNPEGATLCSVGINEDCLGFTQQEVFIECGVIPGPCLPNYSVTDNGTIDSDVFLAGQNCNFAPLNDEIIELTVTCDGNFNFTLTQDAGFWSSESWLTLALGCCSGPIEQTSSFFEESLTIDTYLEAGTYYVIVDIFSAGFQPGGYVIDITSDADLSLITTSNAGADEITCEESINLNGNTPANNENGLWTIISGSGTIIDPFSPNTTAINMENGTNIFEWTITNECSTSSDQINIEVANDIILDLPDTIYCLEQIPLSVSAGAGIDGEWSVTPQFNVSIDNVNSTNTFAEVSAYGNYEFTYTICDESVSQSVNVASILPNISSESLTYYCLENFSLLAEVEGDPGYWESEGPFISTFDNIVAQNPNITVNGYGTYVFTYYGCGSSNNITIEMAGVEPILSGPDTIYCLEAFDLSAQVDGDPGYWDAQGPGIVTFENQGSINTTVTVSEYGMYEFTYYGCGSSNSILVNANNTQPLATGPNEDLYCLEAFNLSAQVDGDPGYWDVQGPGIVTFENQTSTSTSVTVSEYGMYEFTYYGCGTTSNEVIINMNNNGAIITGPDSIICLQEFNLSAQIDGDPGYWEFEGPGNAIFSDQNSTNTSVEVDAYGLYNFIYYGCGINSEPFPVNSISITPTITTPADDLIIYCELATNLQASFNIESPGDGYWDFEGPGNAIFSDQNDTTTSVSVDQYGIYNFMYRGCGASSEPVTINFNNPEPEIDYSRENCELIVDLNGFIQGDNNNVEWFLNELPENASGTFSNTNEFNTQLTVSDYGTYEVGFVGCGNTAFKLININTEEPALITDDFENCILTTTLIAFTDDPNGGGPWTTETDNVFFSNPNSNTTQVTVPDFGLYTFTYPGCGTSSSTTIGFECPLIFPNTITPNGDGNNDIFIIQNLNPEIYTNSVFTVYNRWGIIVYVGTNYGISGEWWNGQTTYRDEKVANGVYYYILEVFNAATKRKEEYSGEINVFMSNSSSLNDVSNDKSE